MDAIIAHISDESASSAPAEDAYYSPDSATPSTSSSFGLPVFTGFSIPAALGPGSPAALAPPYEATKTPLASSISTTWDDMDLSSYLLYGSGFVFMVDSIMYPFEVLRTRMQADNITHQRSVISMVRRIIQQEGFRRLYRGILPSVLGSFPAQSTYYASYEYTHHLYDQLARSYTSNPSAPLTPLQDFACHSLAGFTAESISACFYLPADMISQRLQMQPKFSFHHSEYQYRHALDVARSIYRHQGIRGFYCGLAPHLLAYAPSGAVYFGVYEYTKKAIARGLGTTERAEKYTAGVNAVSASIAGGAGVCVSNPFDVLRTRVQTYHRPSAAVSPSSSSTAGLNTVTGVSGSIWQLAGHVWRTEGASGFTKGIRPRLMVAMPGSMMALSGYELIKSWAVRPNAAEVEKHERHGIM
ncbi:mitochondrial carrier domain-containing protein [Catenaria anguillulae PL171]|uniref:Mitochondrial carrier domain-containing protein n=1 Tax=Catenaria anguillulae PL171 TaxID=765915 RepID=A0A1Y2HNJ0_9FUNG|nr:mitochondrial carrier domain-containing protein [Catenaria anguillulae PL171]